MKKYRKMQKTTFNNLWNKTETTTEYTSGGISYGTTKDSKLASGMKAYATSRHAHILLKVIYLCLFL